ncbi:D-lyxose/D-mannose family sugar isomerase [candidate division KSB1 bacterium]|nr:D-lyxose/D-mannose family sugar isomerase [candidate division KSB1 bacterium]
MNELDRARSIELPAPERDRALVAFDQQIERWGITLPDVEPLVLDFGLGKFDSIGLIEVWIANEIQAGYCGKYLYVADGQTCPLHHHRNKHETFFLLKGRLRVNYGEQNRTLRAGDVLTVTPPIAHSFCGIGPALLLELSQPCLIDDNYFSDIRIPIGGNFKKKS